MTSDLAVVTASELVVSRDKDLLALSDLSSSDARAFAQRFPSLRIVTPVALLAELDREIDAGE